MHMLTKIGRFSLKSWLAKNFPCAKEKQELQNARSNSRGSAKGKRLEQPFRAAMKQNRFTFFRGVGGKSKFL